MLVSPAPLVSTDGPRQVLFSGYHSWHDWYQSANYLVDPESGEFPFAGIEPTGVFQMGLEGELDDLLVAGVKQEPFRRLVR